MTVELVSPVGVFAESILNPFEELAALDPAVPHRVAAYGSPVPSVPAVLVSSFLAGAPVISPLLARSHVLESSK
jgi:hypothetical protein